MKMFYGLEMKDITSYKVSVGGESYYAGVQLIGDGFYAALKFHKEGPLPNASAPATYGQRFYGHMDYHQMPMIVDQLHNGKPLQFGWNDANPNLFHLMTGADAVGEGNGSYLSQCAGLGFEINE